MKPVRLREVSHVWGNVEVPPGGSADVSLLVGEQSSGISVRMPVHVRRGRETGPCLLVTAALHGDEMNGTGAIRELILDDSWQLLRGTLILVPVLNVLGFDSHIRYLPDRRDLNRSFPGSKRGSLASRLATQIYRQLVARADWIVDVHTAASGRTNFPNVRADWEDPQTQKLATAFGSEWIIHGKGPVGSLRRVATQHGCPTITFEGGEVLKVESVIVDHILRGVTNVLSRLGMIASDPTPALRPPTVLRKARWVRADRGGFLRFHVTPGDVVDQGQPLVTNTSLLGKEHSVLVAPFPGIVLGLTTLPAVSMGEAICHLGHLGDDDPSTDTLSSSEEPSGEPHDPMHQQTVDDLATNVQIVEPRGED